MTNILHSQQTAADGIHTTIAYSYADAAARGDASGFVAGDIGKLALQADDGSVWMLANNSPIVWTVVAGPGGAVVLTTDVPIDVDKTTSAVGIAITAARSDHKHDVSTASAAANPPGTTSAEGSASSLARADHTHALPDYGSTSGTIAEGNDSRFTDDRVASGLRTATTVVVISSAAAPSAGQALMASSTTAASWVTPLALTAAAPADVTKAAAVVGVATAAARADHKHDVSTSATGSASVGASASEGSATSLARSDHVHAFSAAAPATIGTSNAAGSATTFVHSDHIHAHGSQTVDTQHALVVAATSHGFMDKADKTKLDDASRSFLGWGNDSVSSSTTTRYLTPGYGDAISRTAPIQMEITRPGTLRDLRVRHNVTAGNGNAIVYTVRVNGVATSITVSLASTSTAGADTANTAAVVAGDRVDVQVTKAASVGTSPSDIQVMLDCAQ